MVSVVTDVRRKERKCGKESTGYIGSDKMSLSRFVRVYNSLPVSERSMTCCVWRGQPISWDLAYKYLKEEGQNADEIQAILEQLELI